MRAFPADWFKAAAAVPNIILALGYQMNIFPIFKGMKKAGDSRMTAAIAVSLSVCTVGANFLNFLSYDKFPKIYYFIIKLSFLISIYFAFPLMFFGSRNNFIALIQLFKLKQKDIEYIKWRQRDEIEHISSYIQED
jgi:amino acid permease